MEPKTMISEVVHLDILEGDTNPSSPINVKVGCLNSGYVRIKAPLLKAICPLMPYRFGAKYWPIRLQQLRLQLRLVYDEAEGDSEGLLLDSEHGSLIADAREEELQQPFVWVHLLFITSRPLAGLLLKRLPQPGRFMRIGYFDHKVPGRHVYDESPRLEPFLRDSYEIRDGDYDEKHQDGVYTITVE